MAKQAVTKAGLKRAWRKWIEDQVKEGRGRSEAEEMAIVFSLCNLFGIHPEQFGIFYWMDGKPLSPTTTTGLIMSSLVLALISERAENPPQKFVDVKELVKTLPIVELYKPAIPAI